MTVVDPAAFVAAFVSDPSVAAALRQGFANALPGVAPEDIAIMSVRALSGARRLQSSGPNLAVDYELRVPAATAAAGGIT